MRSGLLVVALCLALATAAQANPVTGTPGDDVLTGTPAADTLTGLGGNDRLSGGGGDDVLDGGPGSDDMAGGPGRDAATYGGPGPVQVSIDDLANDGSAGENDNVQTDIEDVFGSDGADVLSGSAGANALDAGAGNDQITGGGGADALYGGAGDDRIYARDGVADTIDCGEGFDSAIVDERDRATACEAVDRKPAVPRVEFTLTYEWGWTPDWTSATRLAVLSLQPRAAQITVKCTGPGCPASLKRAVVTHRSNLLELLHGARLRAGALLEVRGTRAKHIARVYRFKIVKNAAPVRTVRCILVGKTRLQACPTSG